MVFPIIPGGMAAAAGSGTPGIQNSLRFRGSSYMTWTPAGAGNRKKATLNFVLKRGALGTVQHVFMVRSDGNNFDRLFFDSSNRLNFASYVGGVAKTELITNAVFRDPSAELDITLTHDSTVASPGASNVYLTINGTVITSLSTATYPPQNTDLWTHSTVQHRIGVNPVAGEYFDGVISRSASVDGQALAGSVFSAADTSMGGEWKPKAASAVRSGVGTWGTNGWLLMFNDTASTTTIGYDRQVGDADTSKNNWASSGISLTAGVTYDALIDSPCNGASATQPVGNYATLNPLVPSAANISKANLQSGTTAVQATLDSNTGVGNYWEVSAGGSAVTAGVISEAGTTHTTTVSANKTYGFRVTSGGDVDYINITDAGAWTSITTGLTGIRFPYGTGAAADWNFGQRPFAGTPSGKALCTANLTSTTITTSGSFTGNLNADGPSPFLNGVPTAMTINGNAVTWGTHALKTAYGFKVISSSASYNNTGSNTFSVTSTGQPLKYANAQINP